ncbi:ABC transporter ATP-binding protein [Mariniblastus fucicola]|uniref:Putative ABC transporter ATP-binding protein n=1 Tax=Mariniblastus fucicola TaxID=980251 RepID=A0A5B9P411_9BACT|nr:ABC transporter ATP-binding protein [Mariniblastus fucicola]QEG21148.1 putative ABC transporter ATP-binding protein [Mariniblastus fucicola]
MIEIQNLEFSWPKSTFDLRIDALQISPGEKLAIIGPSGSGKTTLLNLLAGIEIVDRGELKVLDTELAKLGDAQRRNFRVSNIGFVFQQFELLDYLTVKDNIALPFLVNQNLSSEKAHLGSDDAIAKLAESMGIGDKLRRHPQKLSQGEKQRVAICRALVASPKLILADEPTGNLDPANKHRTLDLLFEQAAANNQTLIVVTHDMSIIDGFDRTIDFSQYHANSAAEASA